MWSVSFCSSSCFIRLHTRRWVAQWIFQPQLSSNTVKAQLPKKKIWKQRWILQDSFWSWAFAMVSFTWPEHGLPHSLFLPARLHRDVMGWQKRSYCSININTNQHLRLLKGLWLSNHLQNWYAIHTGTQQRLREIVAYVMWCSARKRDHKWCEVRTTNSSNMSHLFRASVYVSFSESPLICTEV